MPQVEMVTIKVWIKDNFSFATNHIWSRLVKDTQTQALKILVEDIGWCTNKKVV